MKKLRYRFKIIKGFDKFPFDYQFINGCEYQILLNMQKHVGIKSARIEDMYPIRLFEEDFITFKNDNYALMNIRSENFTGMFAKLYLKGVRWNKSYVGDFDEEI